MAITRSETVTAAAARHGQNPSLVTVEGGSWTGKGRPGPRTGRPIRGRIAVAAKPQPSSSRSRGSQLWPPPPNFTRPAATHHQEARDRREIAHADGQVAGRLRARCPKSLAPHSSTRRERGAHRVRLPPVHHQLITSARPEPLALVRPLASLSQPASQQKCPRPPMSRRLATSITTHSLPPATPSPDTAPSGSRQTSSPANLDSSCAVELPPRPP
jgi:hypothetical protein